MKRSIVLLYILLVCSIFSVAHVSLKTELDTKRILIGGRAALKVSIEVPKNVSPIFPKFKIRQEIVPGIEILNIKRDTITNNTNKGYSVTYILTSWDKNTYKIPSLPVIVEGKTFMSKEFLLTVDEIKINKKQAHQKPSDTIIDVPFKWIDLIPSFLYFIISFIGFIVCFILYKRIIKKNKFIPLKSRAIKLSPYEESMKALNRLRDKSKNITDQKKYYTKITEIIRWYIYKQFNINSLEMTSEEIIESLKAQCDDLKINELQNLFSTADLVKFAKFSTSENDKEYYLSKVVCFIEDTKAAIVETNIDSSVEDKNNDNRLKVNYRRTIIKSIIYIVALVSIVLLLYACYKFYTIVI